LRKNGIIEKTFSQGDVKNGQSASKRAKAQTKKRSGRIFENTKPLFSKVIGRCEKSNGWTASKLYRVRDRSDIIRNNTEKCMLNNVDAGNDGYI
jgi:hypothetical protein